MEQAYNNERTANIIYTTTIQNIYTCSLNFFHCIKFFL